MYGATVRVIIRNDDVIRCHTMGNDRTQIAVCGNSKSRTSQLFELRWPTAKTHSRLHSRLSVGIDAKMLETES